MTIDSTFIACFKEDAPEAFTTAPPFVPQAVFCDGQIKLMSPDIAGTQTWEDYIRRQFLRCVDGHFGRGVRCVIMAFDDYEHVPPAKSMTQLKRRRHLPPLQFNPRDTLPAVVPSGEKWAQSIANRTFKTKVIALVIDGLVARANMTPKQSLIIDYQGSPVRYYREKGTLVSDTLDAFGPMGEADIKFVRYTALYPRLQVDSVDGDSVPIALLHYEKGFDGQISIHRMLTRTADDKALAKATSKAKETTGKTEEDKPKAKRIFEFVDIGMLYAFLRTHTLPQCLDRTKLASHEGHEISMLVSVIGLAGTDFTRGLPQVSGKTLYELLPDLWVKLSLAYDTAAGGLHPQRALDSFVATVYRKKFDRHATATKLGAILRELAASKLSERTKQSLPSEETVHCTVRNVNWLLRYWRDQAFPDPFTPEFGFVMQGGRPAFEA